MTDKPCILVMDDEDHIRILYEESLRDEGYDVIATDDGEKGLELIEKGEVQLVLLDIRMPRMDGRDFLARAREISIDIPIIILSAYPSYKQDFGVWGADAYLLKPEMLVGPMGEKADAHMVKSSDLSGLMEKIRELLEARNS